VRDLVRISDAELQELTSGQRLRMFGAISIAIACGIVSLQGMVALFTDAKAVPLPGMNRIEGQIGWAAALVAMLVAVTFLVRGVIKRRLQWGIALSLLIHFLLCASMSVVEFRGPEPVPAQANEPLGATAEEFTMPDYAGQETPNSDAPWQQQSDTATPENNVELERAQMEIAEADKPQPEDVTQPQARDVEKLEKMERQEQIKLAADAAAEMERQAQENAKPVEQPAEAPKVTTAESAQAVLDVEMQQEKQQTDTPMSEREQTEIAAAAQSVEAAKINAQKSEAEITPEEVQASISPKANAELEAAMAQNEDIEVAAADAQEMKLTEQQIKVARQQAAAAAAGSVGAPSSDSSPSSSASPAISSANPQRAAGVGDPSEEAPTAGGAVTMSRRNANAQAAGTDSGIESVTVSSATGVGAPAMAESSAASANRRGTAASVPAGSDANGAASVQGSGQSNGQISGANIARSSSGGNRPTLGSADGQSAALTGRGEGRQANAVGTTADAAGIAMSGTKGTTNGEALIAGPASTSVGRSKNGLPSRSNSGGTSSGPSSPATGAGSPTGPARSSATAVAGRGTEPSAMLNPNAGFSGGSGPGLAMSRSSASVAALPAGAMAAEQSGKLVLAGPQAVANGGIMSGGGLSGPRVSSVPRRSAGLPGSSGPAAGVAAPSVASSAQPSRVAVGSPRTGVGNDKPKLASADVVAGMIRKSVPGIGGSPEARMAESLSMRTSDARREAARTLGGSPESEDAVERGLAWLASVQSADGHWSIKEFPGDAVPRIKNESFKADSAATGLALLAFLGAGYTHQSGKYQDVVDRGVKWLLQHQKPDGDLFADELEFVWLYSHGMASIALCEAYGMTKDAALKEPAQRALNFIVASQHPDFGGWRYRPRFESDTSVSGWQLMALKSGEMSGLVVPKETYAGVSRWLASVQSKESPGQFSYHPTQEVSPTMTAEGLLMRQYLGAKRNDAQLIAGANFLQTRLPDFGQRDSYYWYYATQVMFHMQGEHWSAWNNSLRDTLVETQAKTGPSTGSWDPALPTPEKWSNAGGRHYVTCLNLLMLEVYYRHLPLYLELEK
jgi:hypothetical protein